MRKTLVHRFGWCSLAGVLLSTTACDDGFAGRRGGTRGVSAPSETRSGSAAVVRSRYEDLERLAERLAQEVGLDPALVFALIDVESGWNPRAWSHKDARGLMQLLPSTARRYGVRDPAGLFDPETNLRAGVAHLKDLLDQFCDVRLALWAYHAGAERVDPTASRITPRETARYVRLVLNRYHARRAGEGPAAPALRYAGSGCGDRTPVPLRLVETPDAEGALAPVAHIANAWVSGAEVEQGVLWMRVGEPVTLKLRAVNLGGPARRGTVSIQLLDHPPLRLGFQSDLPTVQHRRGATGALVEAVANSWDPDREHWLLVRLVPQDVGEIRLVYRATLEDGPGRVSAYPAEGSGRLVHIRVTRTHAGGGQP